jgi:putative FmdB family regulatory protein
MPMYEFRCSACGRRFEALRRLGQGAEGLACPTCGASELQKEFSVPSRGSAGGRGGCGVTSRFT